MTRIDVEAVGAPWHNGSMLWHSKKRLILIGFFALVGCAAPRPDPVLNQRIADQRAKEEAARAEREQAREEAQRQAAADRKRESEEFIARSKIAFDALEVELKDWRENAWRKCLELDDGISDPRVIADSAVALTSREKTMLPHLGDVGMTVEQMKQAIADTENEIAKYGAAIILEVRARKKAKESEKP